MERARRGARAAWWWRRSWSPCQHPNADKLSVTQVDVGRPEPLQVVCGAKNYKVGDKVPLATVGTKLPNGVEIKQAALRGVESFGMLCSAKELGLSEDASGLLILDPDAEAGHADRRGARAGRRGARGERHPEPAGRARRTSASRARWRRCPARR